MALINFKWNFDTLGLIGPKQWGKSTIIKSILPYVPKEDIIVLDTNLEYVGYNRVIPKDYEADTLDNFLRYVRKFVNKLIVLEDLDIYLSGARPSKELSAFLINASHQNLGCIYTAKRPLNIPKLLLTETMHLFVGNFKLQNDINYLSSVFNNVEKIKILNRYEFLYKNEVGEEILYKTKA